MLELDIVLHEFAEQRFEHLSELHQQAFARLLAYPDALLFDYVMGRAIPIEAILADVIHQIRRSAGS